MLIAILIIAVVLVLNWFAAKQFQEIVYMKGHYNTKYFWWCFGLGAIGWAMVIALPDRASTQQENTAETDELPNLDELSNLQRMWQS